MSNNKNILSKNNDNITITIKYSPATQSNGLSRGIFEKVSTESNNL